MNLKSFLKLVEIRTKVASMVPLLLGTVYVLYHYHRFDFVNFLCFLFSALDRHDDDVPEQLFRLETGQ